MQRIQVLAIAVLAVVVLAAGTAGGPQDDVAKELREMKALLVRMSSLADREAHPRLYKAHPYGPKCDMGLIDGKLNPESVCETAEALESRRASALRRFSRLVESVPTEKGKEEIEVALEAIMIGMSPARSAGFRAVANWWKAGKVESDEAHRLAFKHPRGPRCDFGTSCVGEEQYVDQK